MPVRPYNDSAMLLSGTAKRLGVIQATTTKNNHDTTTAFNNTGEALKGKILLLHADAACNVNFGTANDVIAHATVTNANFGVPVAAGERIIVAMHRDYGWIAVVGTANVTVWELI